MSPIPVAKFPWKWLPVHLLTWVVTSVLQLVMILLGLPACAIGVIGLRRMFAFTSPSGNRFPHYLWPWDSRVSTTPESWWWESDRWQHKLGWRFSTWWWRAIRNPVSNFKRWGFFGSDDPSDWQYVRTVKDGDPKHEVRWSLKYWWLMGAKWEYDWSDTHYAQIKLGFKLHSTYEGLGFTMRVLPYRNRDRLK